MRRHDRRLWLASIALALANAVIWGVWVVVPQTIVLAVALVVQIQSGLVLAHSVPRSRRALAASLAITVPVIGPLAAAWAVSVRGRGGDELVRDPHAQPKRIDGSDIAKRLTGALPSCEALVSGDLEARRATIQRLGARAGAEDIAVLRWARTQDDPELAVEVALAFEDISQRFEQQLRAARAQVKAEPSFAAHERAFRVIADGIAVGVVDAQLVGKLAREARSNHEAAIVLEPARARELLFARARFELAVGRPEMVLDLMAEAVAEGSDDELRSLYHEAAYAARRFDLAPVRISTRELAVAGT